MRSFIISLFLLASPAIAQERAPPAGVEQALSEIEAHRVNLRVGCALPMPSLWSAPVWEQRAAAIRRQAFEECLAAAMVREQLRLEELSNRIGVLHAADPNANWLAAEEALERKWSELDTLADKLRVRENRADTAVRILDTFTGPGAPFDTTPRTPYNRCAPYRCDTSTSAPGIR